MTSTPSRDGALLVIDVQNDFCHPDGVFARAGMRTPDLPGLIGHINALAAAARTAGRPVMWVRMEWTDDEAVGLLAERSPFLATEGLRYGTWGAELVTGLDVRSEDPIVTKPRFSAFYQTVLEDLLLDLGINSLVVAGVRTDFCVESTVRDAFFRDLSVIVADDAVQGYFPALHDSSLRLMGTVFAEVVPSAEASTRFHPVPVPTGNITSTEEGRA